jgi:O-antigen ligase
MPLAGNRLSLSKHLVMFWLYLMLIFMPVKIFHLPLNMELVDLWVILALPIFWFSFMLGQPAKISSSYVLAILLILIGSFASAYAATDSSKSIIVVLKEIYLFAWFITVTAIFSNLDIKYLHRILVVWAGAVILHGLLIIAQFLLPEIWRLTTGFAGQANSYALFRPSGLFISEKAGDANKAAVFQLFGFIPLILAKPPKYLAMILATVLFASILATGSMGTTSAFVSGLVIAIIALTFFDRNLQLIKKFIMYLVIIASMLLGTFAVVLSQSESYRAHFEKIIAGRAEKSSGGRFDLWQRGLDAFIEHHVFLWGVGPENFREVDPTGNDNQLHNDFLAFSVERGLIALAGLILIAVVAISRAIYLLREYSKYRQQDGLFIVVILAILSSALLVSLTHQIFHARELWLILALEEALVFKVRETVSLL